MSSPAGYVGVPPPRIKKRKERELSPVIADPEPVSQRWDVFGTPAQSARVKKTYAHKRARSYASSAAEDESEVDELDPTVSPSPPPQTSPTRPPAKSTHGPASTRSANHSTPGLVLNKQPRLSSHNSEPSAPPQPKEHDRGKEPLKRKLTIAYVEVPSRPRTLRQPQEPVRQSRSPPPAPKHGPDASTVRIGPPRRRGRPPKQRAVAIPSPPPTSDDDALTGAQASRHRAISNTHMTLSDALNRSFAPASPITASNATIPAPSTDGPPKRPRGRPPHRGRGAAPLAPAIAHTGPSLLPGQATNVPSSSKHADPVVVPAKRPRGRPRKHPLQAPSGSAPNGASAPRPPGSTAPPGLHAGAIPPQGEWESPEIDAAPVPAQANNVGSISTPAAPAAVPAKRPRGRPRKHPLPAASGYTPNGASTSHPPTSTGRRTEAVPPRDERESSEIDAVAAQLQPDDSLSPDRAMPSSQYAYQSVDVSAVARALERQAAEEIEHTTETEPVGPPPKRKRGRPPGSKNKATLEREAALAAQGIPTTSSPVRPAPAHLPATVASPVRAAAPSDTLPPVPIKRLRGRPRKSAPSAFPPTGTMDYVEPLKDPDAEPSTAGPSTPGRRPRGRSRTRRNSTSAVPSAPASAAPTTPRAVAPAVPVAPSSYYLDLNTMQWKRRASSLSTSPKKRRPAGGAGLGGAGAGPVTEYQTIRALCSALKNALASATPKAPGPPKAKKGKGKGKETGLKVALSGVLLFADMPDGDLGSNAGSTRVFGGSCAILADPSTPVDDGLALKKLHEVVRLTEACVRLEEARFTQTADGRTTTVTVPCCCDSVRAGGGEYPSRSDAEQPACAGTMAVSVSGESLTDAYVGIGKALRTTVVVTH